MNSLWDVPLRSNNQLEKTFKAIIDPIHKWPPLNILLYLFKLTQLTSFEGKSSFELSNLENNP